MLLKVHSMVAVVTGSIVTIAASFDRLRNAAVISPWLINLDKT